MNVLKLLTFQKRAAVFYTVKSLTVNEGGLGDFSENFSFIVQDAALGGFHFPLGK